VPGRFGSPAVSTRQLVFDQLTTLLGRDRGFWFPIGLRKSD
jgi:hypothetical protein